jgi:hypothetical protein
MKPQNREVRLLPRADLCLILRGHHVIASSCMNRRIIKALNTLCSADWIA